jgi:hypothetical protein
MSTGRRRGCYLRKVRDGPVSSNLTYSARVSITLFRMPYRNPVAAREYQRRYQKEWIRKRRREFFADKMCARCGTTEDLELDHIDPATKVTTAIWSWRAERRAEELAKCQILCHPCHREKTVENNDNAHGESSSFAKLGEVDVEFILRSDLTNRQCADMFNVDITNIQKMRRGETWKHVHRRLGAQTDSGSALS